MWRLAAEKETWMGEQGGFMKQVSEKADAGGHQTIW